jgi:predicted mannosyl-3-phosphoglycerate phosphatase (HAD superfamily)
MPGPLKNARHERFAQELAKGKSQSEAYGLAGYRQDRTAASRLSSNVNVTARATELKSKAADKAVVTIENLTERLLAIATKGEAAHDAPLLSVGRAALMDVAKLNGLITEKSAVDLTSAGQRLGLGEFYGKPSTGG